MQIYFNFQRVIKLNVSAEKPVGIMPKFKHLLLYIIQDASIEELASLKGLNTNPSGIVLKLANPVY
jgi:hypothetical protein